jgi:hypothetical protein
VWPDVAVADAALSQALQRLRRALGDDARQPRYIETCTAAVSVSSPPCARRPSQRRRRGARQVVFIEGKAGLGKTALLNAFLADHAADGLRIATSPCIEQQGKAEPYLPVFEALDRFVRSDRSLIEVLRHHAPTWLAQLP